MFLTSPREVCGTYPISDVLEPDYTPKKSGTSRMKQNDSIVEFVGLRYKMFSLTVCDASQPISGVNYLMDVRHKAMANGVLGSQIRSFKHEDYLCMYNNGAFTNVVKYRIGSKFHQVRLIILN